MGCVLGFFCLSLSIKTAISQILGSLCQFCFTGMKENVHFMWFLTSKVLFQGTVPLPLPTSSLHNLHLPSQGQGCYTLTQFICLFQLSSLLPSSSRLAFDQSPLGRRSSLDLAEIFLRGLLLRPSSPACNGLRRASSQPELRASSESWRAASTWAQPNGHLLLRQPGLRRPRFVWGLVATRNTHQQESPQCPVTPARCSALTCEIKATRQNTISHVRTLRSARLALSVNYRHQTTLHLKATSMNMYLSDTYA